MIFFNLTMPYENYNIILINIDGFRKDKIDFCPSLKSIKENSHYFGDPFKKSRTEIAFEERKKINTKRLH